MWYHRRMPVDWKLAAAAFAPEIPEEQVERIAPILEQLQQTLEPVFDELPFEAEP